MAIAAKKHRVGARYWRPRWRGHSEQLWARWRIPGSRRTLLLTQGRYNPKDLSREILILDKRPLWWAAALGLLAILPPVLGLQLESASLLSAAAIFALYAAINLVWMLVIGTAGIFSLASLAIVGAAAYCGAYLSIEFGLPWWGMVGVGAATGGLFGLIIALPAMRLEGFYYALLTLGLVELCRVSVVQSQALGSATGGLFGAASYLPDGLDEQSAMLLSYVVCFSVMLLALGLYRVVNGMRLGRLLRSAPEKQEAFAQACGIDVRRARLQVFIISSSALGAIGGIYAAHFQGASPSLFGIDNLLLMLAMIVIGGLGTAEGAVAGTLIVVMLDKLLIEWGSWRLVLIGALMLATVLYTRAGLMGVRAQFRAWRLKKQSEARAMRSEAGGEVMPEEAIAIADKALISLRSHDKRQRDGLKRLITPAVLEEHRVLPWGQHAEDLTRLLHYFRFAAITDKYALMSEKKAFKRYRLIALSGQRGVPPRLVDDKHYDSIEAATHAVFLKRCQDLLES
ncbi:branched-chain amino acid ABC transporter permease [Paucibacter sp. KBW04]|uniref:branched-chain amino acid ABC transporter permease n=1 Tax=Paucibacter sp. KBW04 TaxID=2153361 RepID=UPI000F582788|nr:branched-chain amino acid ABC transporter permease [Paucibacter sp. KBW04]RQO63528.1 branched-chain amino acid ABC transporter permease [Paucibacter sp. KBW04]